MPRRTPGLPRRMLLWLPRRMSGLRGVWGGFVIWLVALSVHHFAVSMVVAAFLLGNSLSSSSASAGPDPMLGPKRWVPSPCLVST